METAKKDRSFIFDHIRNHLGFYSIGAEIGVHLGDFSLEILDTIYPKKLYLIDPWEYQEDERYSESLYGGEGLDQDKMDERYFEVLRRFYHVRNVQVIRERSRTALERFKDQSLEWVYIDGNHSYKEVFTDLMLSRQKVKVGGLIIGDDYDFPGWWGDGINRAVNRFRKEDGVELREIKNHQFIFRKIA